MDTTSGARIANVAAPVLERMFRHPGGPAGAAPSSVCEVVVGVVVPDQHVDGAGFSLRSTADLSWALEDALSQKIRKRVLATAQRFGGAPREGMTVVVQLRFPESWGPASGDELEPELSEFVAGCAARTVQEVLVARPARR